MSKAFLTSSDIGLKFLLLPACWFWEEAGNRVSIFFHGFQPFENHPRSESNSGFVTMSSFIAYFNIESALDFLLLDSDSWLRLFFFVKRNILSMFDVAKEDSEQKTFQYFLPNSLPVKAKFQIR